MPRDEKMDNFIDDLLKDAQSRINVLSGQQKNLTVNVKELEKKRDALSSEIRELEVKHSNAVKQNKDEVEAMMASGNEKLAKAAAMESEAVGKLTELNLKVKEAEDLIKSNKGLQDNLVKQGGEVKSRIEDLNKKVSDIKDIVKSL